MNKNQDVTCVRKLVDALPLSKCHSFSYYHKGCNKQRNKNNITYNSNTKEVKVFLPFSFSSIGDFDENTYPIRVNDRVLIENVSVGVGSGSQGGNNNPP